MQVRPLTDQEAANTRFFPVRQALRQFEFGLPLSLQAPLLRLLGSRYDPYDETTDRTRSIFIHIPRSAGTSVALAMNRNGFHYAASRYAAVDRDRFDRYFKFAFVRNPWDRLLSGFSRLRSPVISAETAAWAHRNVANYSDFEQFVVALEDARVRRRMLSFLHFRPQLDWVSLPGRRKVELDFVGRFESLSADFQTVCEKLGIEAALPATNASVHAPYQNAYTPRMRDIVGKVYRDDIEAFEYDF